jgi:hypothetical protein
MVKKITEEEDDIYNLCDSPPKKDGKNFDLGDDIHGLLDEPEEEEKGTLEQ